MVAGGDAGGRRPRQSPRPRTEPGAAVRRLRWLLRHYRQPGPGRGGPVTGQVASGANVVCFTTGRGSVFGFKPSPSIKLATNSAMYNRMTEDMDINCGGIADGEASVAEVGRAIFDKVLAVPGGTPSQSDALGFGDAEFERKAVVYGREGAVRLDLW